MRLIRVMVLAIAVVSAVVMAPNRAQAGTAWTISDAAKQDRPVTIDLLGSFWLFGNTTWFGGAGWFCYPILPEGFLPKINDVFYLELGAYAFYYNERVAAHADYSYLGIIPAGGVRWDFNLTKSWTVFGAVKAGLAVGTGDAPRQFWFVPVLSVGGFWNFSRSLFLRLEAGNQGLLQAGVSIVL